MSIKNLISRGYSLITAYIIRLLYSTVVGHTTLANGYVITIVSFKSTDAAYAFAKHIENSKHCAASVRFNRHSIEVNYIS